jgi:general secretion pathway protein F
MTNPDQLVDNKRAAIYAPVGTQNTHFQFRLNVRDADGGEQWVELIAASEADALRKMTAQGLRIVAVEAVLNSDQATYPSTSATKFDLLVFSQELLALLEAGLNLTEALITLHAKERRRHVQQVLAGILSALRQGKNFSDVLGLLPAHFPVVYVATVRASERTGDLPQSLKRYIAYQIQFEQIRKKLMSAAIYPALLLFVGGLVTLFLMGYVVPRFALVYESSGRDIPWMSAALLAFGKLVHQHAEWSLGGGLAALIMFAWSLSRPAGRSWLVAQVLRLPWLSEKANEFQLARFYWAVSLLLASGIALPRAMKMSTGLLGLHQQTRMSQCQVAVEEGQRLSVALTRVSLASPVAQSLIAVGERSGQMAEMLERTARFADDDFARWVDWASRLLEPILMMIIGLVIGAVVVLMYMPIFELAGSL